MLLEFLCLHGTSYYEFFIVYLESLGSSVKTMTKKQFQFSVENEDTEEFREEQLKRRKRQTRSLIRGWLHSDLLHSVEATDTQRSRSNGIPSLEFTHPRRILLDRGKMVRWGRRGLRTLRRERNAMQIFTTAGEGKGATHAERDRSKPPHPPNLTRLIGMCLRFLFIRLKLFDILSQHVLPRESLMDRGYNGCANFRK